MRIRETNEPEEGSDMAGQMIDLTRSTYRRFSDYVELREDDPIWMMLYKLFFRLIGILFFIAISPVVLLGLIIAFLAVL